MKVQFDSMMLYGNYATVWPTHAHPNTEYDVNMLKIQSTPAHATEGNSLIFRSKIPRKTPGSCFGFLISPSDFTDLLDLRSVGMHQLDSDFKRINKYLLP